MMVMMMTTANNKNKMMIQPGERRNEAWAQGMKVENSTT
jgi:hypothetical protein